MPLCRSLLPLFPSLTSLSLEHNNVSTLDPDPSWSGDSICAFASIDSLNLAYNAIESPAFISYLPLVFPNLLSLRVSGNSFFEPANSSTVADSSYCAQDGPFMLTLARVPSLLTLNYSSITERERMDAELYYISMAQQEIEQAMTRSSEEPLFDICSDLTQNWSRYEELCAKYDRESKLPQPATSAPNAVSQPSQQDEDQFPIGSFGAQLLTINFVLERGTNKADCFGDQNISESPILTLKLPRTMSIYRVKGVLFRKIGSEWGLKPLQFDLKLSKKGELGEQQGEDSKYHSARQVQNDELVPDSTRGLGDWVRTSINDTSTEDVEAGTAMAADVHIVQVIPRIRDYIRPGGHQMASSDGSDTQHRRMDLLAKLA